MTRSSLVGALAVATVASTSFADQTRAAAEPIGHPVSQLRGSVSSPDKRIVVEVRPGDDAAPDADPRSEASLVLRAAGRPPRFLARFYRSGSVYWTPDSRHLIFVAEGVTDTQVYIFGRDGSSSAPGLDGSLRRMMKRLRPPIEVEVHTVTVRRIGTASILLRIYERGLLPGSHEGPENAREEAFLIRYEPFRIEARRGAGPS